MTSFFAALLFSFATVPTAQNAGLIGYVVNVPPGTSWEAINTGERGPRPLVPGAPIRQGDTVRVPAGKDSASGSVRISILFFSTGDMRLLKSGERVDAGQPSPPTTLSRLLSALDRWLNRETIASGIVRASDPMLHDGVLVTGSRDWRRILSGLPPARYGLRFRRLDADGTPDGDWTAAQTIEVAADGRVTGSAGETLAPGLWQVGVRDQSLTVSGTAWVLLANKTASDAFYELSARLDAVSKQEGTEANESIQRVKRAALLELASQSSR